MEYTIKKLAQLTGVSSRTLRYYDQIGLLPPKRVNTSGYRIYGRSEIDKLSQILFLKNFGLSLDKITEVLNSDQEQFKQILEEQHQHLLQERSLLDNQITYLKQNLADLKGENKMTDEQKFEQMKQQQIADNEANYGSEIREKYGEQEVVDANEHWAHLSQADYDRLQKADATLIEALDLLSQQTTIDLDSDLAKTAFEAHKEWLTIAAPFYNSEYHKGLADMYLADERFAKNYDGRTTNPSTQILHDIIWHYAK